MKPCFLDEKVFQSYNSIIRLFPFQLQYLNSYQFGQLVFIDNYAIFQFRFLIKRLDCFEHTLYVDCRTYVVHM
jgi:hypothetical protein